MEELYRITTPGEGTFKEKGSRFLAFAYPVQNLAEIDQQVQDLKKRFYDARHHCYAYRLGAYGETIYVNDDGEPSHTAGTPILSAIRSAATTDLLVVVVRYFGGTKLGVRGLIEAYRTAADLALAEAEKTAVLHQTTFELKFAYDQTADLNRILHPFPVEQVEATYTDVCRIRYVIDETIFPSLSARLTEARFEISVLENE